jgi:hypothetical protein
VGKIDPSKKKSLFSTNYSSLFTMFPQLWINENNIKEGENEDKKILLSLL